MASMRIPIPDYVRTDALLVGHTIESELTTVKGPARRTLRLQLSSVHGPDCPLPWLARCAVSFAHLPDGPHAVMEAPEDTKGSKSPSGRPWSCTIPIEGEAWSADGYLASLDLTFALGTTAEPCALEYAVVLRQESSSRRGTQAQGQRYELVTCRQSYGESSAAGPSTSGTTKAAVETTGGAGSSAGSGGDNNADEAAPAAKRPRSSAADSAEPVAEREEVEGAERTEAADRAAYS